MTDERSVGVPPTIPPRTSRWSARATSAAFVDAVTVEIRDDDDLERLLPTVTNWGRWGADDRIGTVNLITAERRRRAAALVRTGRAVPLARPTGLGDDGVREGQHRAWTEDGVSRDYAGAVWHGFALTHLDALCHVATPDGRLYGGIPASDVGADGAGRLGVDQLAAHGLCGRGVLLDVAADGPLEPGTAIRVADLERAEVAQSVRVEEGDLLLVRTGRAGTRERRSGLHPECLPWLHERGVALLGGDGDSDVHPAPPGFDRWASTMHAAALPYLGLPLLDGAELDPLAAACHDERRWEFLLTVTPWRITGTTSAGDTPGPAVTAAGPVARARRAGPGGGTPPGAPAAGPVTRGGAAGPWPGRRARRAGRRRAGPCAARGRRRRRSGRRVRLPGRAGWPRRCAGRPARGG